MGKLSWISMFQFVIYIKLSNIVPSGLEHDRGTKNACNSKDSNYGWRDPSGNFRTIMGVSLCISNNYHEYYSNLSIPSISIIAGKINVITLRKMDVLEFLGFLLLV